PHAGSIVADRLEQENLRARAARSFAEESRLQHARGVEHEHVTGGNQVDDVAEAPVLDPLGLTMHDHEPAGGSFRQWLLRDERRRQIVIVVGSALTTHVGVILSEAKNLLYAE